MCNPYFYYRSVPILTKIFFPSLLIHLSTCATLFLSFSKALCEKVTQVLNVMTDSKLSILEEENEVNMCKATDDIRKEGQLEGQ